MITLPEILLNELSDIICTSSWDMGLGAVEFFNQLQNLFSQSPFHFTWSLDKAQGKLDFEIDSIAWSTNVQNMDLIDKSFSFSFNVDSRGKDFQKGKNGIEWAEKIIKEGDQKWSYPRYASYSRRPN